jgi:hypothetical protein
MGALLRVIGQIVLLRQGPQVLPASRFLLWLALGAHWLTGVALGLYSLPPVDALFSALVGTLIMAALVHTLLLHRRHNRLNQTLTALAACETLLGLMALPLTALFYAGASLQDIAAMLSLLLLGWNVTVAAHIFRHALGTSMGVGFLFAIGYTLISLSLGGLVATPEG